MIFIYPVENVIRISTGEEGHDAISYQGDIDTRRKQNLVASQQHTMTKTAGTMFASRFVK